MTTKMVALVADDDVVEQLALFTEYGAFTRDDGEWVPVQSEYEDPEDDPIDGLEAVDAGQDFLSIFDDAQRTDATLMRHDVQETD